MAKADDRADIAAALIVAVEAGLLTADSAVRVIDAAVATDASTPPTWLVDASLAKQAEDVLRALRKGASEHPMLLDGSVRLEAIGRAFAKGLSWMDAAYKVNQLFFEAEWPDDIAALLSEVHEESTCGYTHGGPKAQYVEAALRALFDFNAGRSVRIALLDRVAQ